MKRVLMVSCNGLGNGGVHSVMMNIIRSLKNEYYFDMLLFTCERRYYDNEFENYGKIMRIPAYEGNNNFRRRLDYYVREHYIEKKLTQILRVNEPYDVIHCNNEFESGICVKVAAKMGIKVRIVHSHTAPKESVNLIRSFINKHYVSLISKYATVLLGCSEDAAHFLFGNSDKTQVLCNAIDLQRFDLKKYPRQKRKNSFIHVGFFSENKNQEFIVDVFSVIHQKYKDATLKLVGSGDESYIRRVKNKVEKYKLTDSVSFLPHDSDIPALMAEAEFMIFPSHSEGFSLVTLEAQVMGVTCFVSQNVPGCANMGGCYYLKLDKGRDYWSDIILGKLAGKNEYLIKNMYEFGLEYYSQQIRRLYEGGKLLESKKGRK